MKKHKAEHDLYERNLKKYQEELKQWQMKKKGGEGHGDTKAGLASGSKLSNSKQTKVKQSKKNKTSNNSSG